jgi:hypothetical protein
MYTGPSAGWGICQGQIAFGLSLGIGIAMYPSHDIIHLFNDTGTNENAIFPMFHK